jgi:hypothetical protein
MIDGVALKQLSIHPDDEGRLPPDDTMVGFEGLADST